MNISLSPDVQKLLEARMREGGYASPEDVILAALGALQQVQDFGDFAPGELDALLAEGEASGPPMDGEQAFAARRQRRQAKLAAGIDAKTHELRHRAQG